jgi:hypothetical protein
MVPLAAVAQRGRSGGKSDGGYVLGLVPVGVAVVFCVLLLPRRAEPQDVPVPLADGRVLAHIRGEERTLATRELSGDARALGSAIRAFNQLEAKQETDPFDTPVAMERAKQLVMDARGPLVAARDNDALLALRATQLEAFVDEVDGFRRTGVVSDELVAVGGPFVKRMRDVGWGSERALEPDDATIRVMFKHAWNALVGVDGPPFAVALDEERLLYAFYIRHPHAPESARKRIDEARRSAPTPRACAQLDDAERLAAEQWRIEKVKHLRDIDPAYPASFALGVAYYRHRDFPASAQAFHDWLAEHPDGPWAIRARHYWHEALYQAGVD